MAAVVGAHLPGMNTTDPADPTVPAPSTTWRVGTLVLTLWPDAPLGEHQRYAYRVEDTATGQAIEGRDLFTGAGAPVSPDRAVRDLAGFLAAAGEARQYALDHPGAGPEDEGPFPGWVAEAVQRNADALTLLAAGEHVPAPPARRPRPVPEPPWFTRPGGGAAGPSRGSSRGRSL